MQRDGRQGNRPPSVQRGSSVQRSGSRQRTSAAAGAPTGGPRPDRPPSRISDSGSQVSPSSDCSQPVRSLGRLAQEPPQNFVGARDAQGGIARRAGQQPVKGPLSAAGAVVGSKPARSASTGPGAGRAASNSARGGSGEVTKTPVFAYLKVYGLQQYARAFLDGGLTDLESIGRLSETQVLEFLERLRVYPGHRLRLLRSMDCLRHAVLGAERRDAAQMLDDDAALERLCVQKEELSKEKSEAEHESRRLHDENKRLLQVVREQGSQLQKARDRVAELEELVQAQTEQVAFLAQQLQLIAEAGGPERANELYKSYKGSFEDTNDADWKGAKELILPDGAALLRSEDAEVDFSKAQSLMVSDSGRAAPNSAPAPTSRNPVGGRFCESPRLRQSQRGPLAGFSPPRRAKMAQSLDSAKISECLAGFDVEHVIKCLATALQNQIILAISKANPHTASADRLAVCAIFLEPVCRVKLEEQAARRREQAQVIPPGDAATPGKGDKGACGSDVGTPLSSFPSPFLSRVSVSLELKDSIGKPFDPLNAIAIRSVPNNYDIFGFLRDVMVNFRLEPEVSVVTLVYIERFISLSGITMTPDNWQRLTIAAMMLASKVWNDESFENAEFAQLCPLYTLDEINTFERIFLKCVGYNMSVKGSEYAKTYFLLRTLGAKDSADFTMEPIDNVRASRLQERCLEKQIEFRERYPDDVANLMNWTL
eukprot:TRINITY_DN10122_c0_g1_i3.p1 TRINITY_DN10122_c0_g1~~TRINITY_DN10122_c0_g1_i3.p1  ORF type:complete len:711 (-),score=114.36 TRINITY_DN10122_c0_g1_i3:137-2269(-)